MKPLGGKAALVDVLLVTEVWQGGVHVFDVQGHPKATRADAWASPIGGYKATALPCRVASCQHTLAAGRGAGSRHGREARSAENGRAGI